MAATKHVVLIHGSWSRGEQWAPARAAFEERGYTVHAPTLRHHELSLAEGATKIAPLSILDYTRDLVAFVGRLDSHPLLVGHSLGGRLAQLVAARTGHCGLVAACPSPAGISGTNPTTLGIASEHFRQSRPWAKPVYPPTWQRFRQGVAHAQTEEAARELLADMVCESRRVIFRELSPGLDRAKVASVDYSAVSGPVLVIAGGVDRIVPPRAVRSIAGRYARGSYVEIPGSDHLVFHGKALPITMRHINEWLETNDLLPNP